MFFFKHGRRKLWLHCNGCSWCRARYRWARQPFFTWVQRKTWCCSERYQMTTSMYQWPHDRCDRWFGQPVLKKSENQNIYTMVRWRGSCLIHLFFRVCEEGDLSWQSTCCKIPEASSCICSSAMGHHQGKNFQQNTEEQETSEMNLHLVPSTSTWPHPISDVGP